MNKNMTIEELKTELEYFIVHEYPLYKTSKLLHKPGYDLLTEILQGANIPEFTRIFGEVQIIEKTVDKLSYDQTGTSYIFTLCGLTLRLDTLFDSWDGGYFDARDMYEVVPVTQTVTVYEKKNVSTI